MNSDFDLLCKPFNKWDVHDLIYAKVTDFKCFDGLALGKEFFKEFLFWYKERLNEYKI